MPTPAELRAQSSWFLEVAGLEPVREIRRRLASHALALALRAEQIEWHGRARAGRHERWRGRILDPRGADARRDPAFIDRPPGTPGE